MNVLIIGFGKMGQTRAKHLEQIDVVDKIYVCDKESALNKKDLENRIFLESPDEIIQTNQVDVVFICTPNYLNAYYTCLGLENNKHVFCEKPAALNLQELQKVIKSKENSKNNILMYGFNHRFHESIIKMRSIVESGEIGKIIWMRGRYGKGTDKSFLKVGDQTKNYRVVEYCLIKAAT